MDPLDILWHLLNFIVPAVGLGMLAAAAAKLLWRGELAGATWARLARDCAAVACAVSIGGLLLSGHDGRMLTYATMVVGCALTLWWHAFGPRRR